MKLIPIILLCGLLGSCAQQVAPNGGKKDEIAPKAEYYKPENKSTKFDSEKIIIKFDEYIQIKDPSQIVISPFLKDRPLIEAVGKSIEITFLRAKPQANTTYTINFGNSIVDVNEGNVLSNFTYVFATGDVLDSNYIEGTLQTAFKNQAVKGSLIALYKKSTFTDSTLQKNYPTYFTKSKDDGSFIIENLPNDSFYIFAFNDANSDNKYQKNENVAFSSEVILTSNSVDKISLKQFEPNLYEPDHLLDTISKQRGKFQFCLYDKSNITIKYLGQQKTYEQTKLGSNNIDTLCIYIPQLSDTIIPNFYVTKKDTSYQISLRTKGKIKSPEYQLQLEAPKKPGDTLKLISNTPIDSIPFGVINIKEDSTKLDSYSIIQKSFFEWDIYFPMKENMAYSVLIEDSTLINNYSKPNKQTQVNFISPDSKNFGNLILTVKSSTTENIIIQLVEDDKEEKVFKSFYNPKDGLIEIKHIKPGNYRLKVIADKNSNQKWDTGNLKKSIQPESVYYHDQVIVIKAYWDIEQSIDLNKLITN